jgi:hypothetical protein
MTVISFRRQSPAGRGAVASDFMVSRYRQKAGHRQGSIGLRFKHTLLKRLGWQVGDYLTCDFERSGSTGIFTIARVPSGRQGGIMLSQNNKTSSAVARFCHEEAVLDMVFPHDVIRFEGELIEHVGNSASFSITYEQPGK